ncbi:helix-turn-helix domain-containing protein [Pseudonocardia sp. CA-107938]|uniref:helix-turn-helix domain-containing protein n=1 Tax=Pseudonocardia sp. CA-107938 TaxID=3240021 RepID=UPI003D8F576C
MTTPTPPAGRLAGGLGARLRALREAAGYSGVEFAAALGAGWRQSKISKIETGRQVPSAAEIAAWAALTGADAEPLVALRAKASAEFRSFRESVAAAGGSVARQNEIDALDRSSTSIRQYQAVLIPGHLQTPSYMREMWAGDEDPADDNSPEATDRLIAARVRRQAILYEPGREIVHVVSEAVLRTRYGKVTRSTLRAQLLHLAEMAALPRNTFGVIPFSAQFPVAAGEFVLYDRDLVVVESAAGEVHVTEPDTVARYARWFDRLLAAALTGDEAAEFCRAVARELEA